MRFLSAGLLIALAPALAAQTDGVLVSPYITPAIPLSTEAQGVAEAGAFGATADPLRMLDNPAILADFAGGVSVSGDQIPTWLGIDGISTQALAVAGGGRVLAGGVPVSLAAGLAYGAFDQPPYFRTDVQGNALGVIDPGADQTFAFGLGASVEGPVRVRAGTSVRHYVSSQYPALPQGVDRVSGTALDFGLDVAAPVGDWIMPTPDGGFKLVADLSAGYALRGVGRLSESSFIADFGSRYGTSVSGRVRRTPVAGVGLLVGFDAGLGTGRALRGASFEYLTTADGPEGSNWGLSAKNVILGVGDEFDSSIVRRGYRLTLAETLTLSAGTLRGASLIERRSRGLTLSLGGALRLAGVLGAGERVYEIGRRVDLRYSYAAYTFGEEGTLFDRTVGHGLTQRFSFGAGIDKGSGG